MAVRRPTVGEVVARFRVHFFFIAVMLTAGGSSYFGLLTTHHIETFVMLDIATHWYHARHTRHAGKGRTVAHDGGELHGDNNPGGDL